VDLAPAVGINFLLFRFRAGEVRSYQWRALGSSYAPSEIVVALLRTQLERADAILFGSVGGPKWENLPPKEQPERAALLPLRKRFKLFANVRPVLSFEGTRARYENIDIITIRENTEGMYSGRGQTVSEDDGVAEAVSVITRSGSESSLRCALELAGREGQH